MRAAAGTRHELADARETPAPGATLAPQRPLITSASRRHGPVTKRYTASRRHVGRWIYYPYNAVVVPCRAHRYKF